MLRRMRTVPPRDAPGLQPSCSPSFVIVMSLRVPPVAPSFVSRRGGLYAAVCCALVLAACGGGGADVEAARTEASLTSASSSAQARLQGDANKHREVE